MKERLRWWIKAVTPPILIIGTKKALRAVGLLGPPESGPAPPPAEPAPPPEWEHVPEGFARRSPGWEGGEVPQAYAAKWREYLDALEGPGPLGIYHETRVGEPIRTDDPAAHNMLLSFAYVLARAAHGRQRLSVLDWGGGLAQYHALGRAVLPEVELEWHCRELPSIAAAGKEVNPAVVFHDDDSPLERHYDLVLASGSLQYAEHWPELLARLGGAAERFLYVTRLPVALESPSFVVLQRAHVYGYATEYLGWVVSRAELLERAAASRLELVREFLLDAWLSAAGAPEAPTPHRGFLFRPAPA
jgi:putative methyltransferase (TIGR04325 family)